MSKSCKLFGGGVKLDVIECDLGCVWCVWWWWSLGRPVCGLRPPPPPPEGGWLWEDWEEELDEVEWFGFREVKMNFTPVSVCRHFNVRGPARTVSIPVVAEEEEPVALPEEEDEEEVVDCCDLLFELPSLSFDFRGLDCLSELNTEDEV